METLHHLNVALINVVVALDVTTDNQQISVSFTTGSLHYSLSRKACFLNTINKFVFCTFFTDIKRARQSF